MTSIFNSLTTTRELGDQETDFFPMPDSMRTRRERRRRMTADLIPLPFTGVPSGFYRSYAMQSPLQLSPSIVQDTAAEGNVSAVMEEAEVPRQMARFEEAEQMRADMRANERAEREENPDRRVQRPPLRRSKRIRAQGYEGRDEYDQRRRHREGDYR